MSKKKKLTSLEKEILTMLRSYPDANIPGPLLQEALDMKGKKGEEKLKKALYTLRNKDQIRMTRGNLVSINEVEAVDDPNYEGRLDVTSRGDGYVIVEGRDQDIKVSSRYLGTALDGDTVRVKITHYHNKSNKPIGQIVEVVKRGKSLFVGTLDSPAENTYLIRSDQHSSRTDFFVDSKDLSGARPGDKVTFKLIQWDDIRGYPQASIVRNLGKAGSNEANILSILSEQQFDATFPPEVESFADSIDTTITAEEISRRRDLRNEVTFTIDPADAKDFDDALSIKMLDNGNYYLGVHIADVTHYLPRGSVLDDEAVERATSVYLVDRVIPMLPEVLSNGVCSLRPEEDKLTFSCFMEITPDGSLVDYSIEETIIHSKQRFVYDEVQEILDGANHQFKPQLKSLETMAKTLLENRFKQGSINFETPEPKFILDEKGKPIDVIVKERLFAHRLIEECMLMANRTVAFHIEQLRKKTGKGNSMKHYPFFYRIHDQPDMEKLFNIRENVKPLGIEFDVKKKVTSKDINDLLKKVEDTSLEHIINDLILRSMSKAVYSPENIGHFGLGFAHYAHFTSPIRRYPDVIVHRLLKRYRGGGQEYTFEELVQRGEHCSEKERSAIQAERDSVKLKQVEFLTDRIGESFDGVISGVTENGLYVNLKDVYCDGMIRVSDLKDDYYIYNPQRHNLTGKSKGKKYRLGDEIRAKVTNTNLDRRQIDLTLSD